MTFLSIIVPIYNMERYLPDCLASLDRQHFGEDVEILLLDDGSTDGSSALCDAAAAENPCYRVIHQENRGVAATRNRGLREARGKYIAWVDPDDYITDDWWKTLRPVLEESPDLVYFDLTSLEDGRLEDSHFDTTSRVISHDEWCRELANGNRIMSHLWSKIFLRTLFDQAMPVFDEKMSYCEDYRALHRVTLPIRACVYLHRCLYVYRQLQTSIVHDEKKTLENAWLGVEISRERRDYYRAHGVDVSDFGVLYAKYQYCNTCRGQSRKGLTKEQRQRWRKCLSDLRDGKQIWQSAPTFGKGNKLKLQLMLNHLGFLIRPMSWAKQKLKNRSL